MSHDQPYLTEIHDNALVYFLPQMSTKDLDERDFQSRDFPMHEDSSEVELNLKPDVDVGSVDGR